MEEVRCGLQYSRRGAAFLAVAVAATLLLLFLVPFPDEVRAAACVLVIGEGLRAHARLAAALELRLDCRRGISVRERTGWREGEIRDGSFVAPWLTIVRWRPRAARLDRTLLLLPGMAAPEELRKIRVILRWS